MTNNLQWLPNIQKAFSKKGPEGYKINKHLYLYSIHAKKMMHINFDLQQIICNGFSPRIEISVADMAG